MRAVVAPVPGGPEVLRLGEFPDVAPGPGEIVITVEAAGVNRADLLQRQGLYPPPPGVGDVLGLECSGIVSAVGAGVSGWAVGQRVCALLDGGGYAQQAAVPVGQVMPIPAGADEITAAGLPEAACTVYSNLAMAAHLRAGEWLLIHGGSGGIGVFAIQWARAIGARVAATAGSEAKLTRCADLGAEVLINYREEDFAAVMKEATRGRGADVILDVMGAKYLDANVRTLANNGRLVVIGLQGGTRAELDLGRLIGKRGTVIATSLRSRPASEKADICSRVVSDVWPLVADGRIRPVIDRVLPLSHVADAHRAMEAGEHFGKIILQVG